MAESTRWIAVEVPVIREGVFYRLLSMSGLEVFDSEDPADIIRIAIERCEAHPNTPMRIVKRTGKGKTTTPEQHMEVDLT